MKKILLLLDGNELPMHVINSAIDIARADNALLHALFIVPDIYKVKCPQKVRHFWGHFYEKENKVQFKTKVDGSSVRPGWK